MDAESDAGLRREVAALPAPAQPNSPFGRTPPSQFFDAATAPTMKKDICMGNGLPATPAYHVADHGTLRADFNSRNPWKNRR
jgi:hypothetical protein